MPRRLPVEHKPIDETSELWDVLNFEQKLYLRNNSAMRHFRKNELIHQEGEKPTHLFCLIKGKIKITKTGMGGRAQIVRMIKPVECTGHRAIFAEDNYTTSGTAVEASDIYMVDIEAFRELVFNCPQLSHYFLQRLSLDLGEADNRLVNLTQKHMRGRLAEALCFLIDNYGYERDGVTLSIYLSREDLANLANMTTSSASRTLSNFANQKLVVLDGRIIKIIDENGLRHVSKFG